jgi:hypothetical protein
MNFSISLTDRDFLDGSERFQVGEIQTGKFYETFMASLSYWNKTAALLLGVLVSFHFTLPC